MPWLTPSSEPTYAELAARGTISGGGGISSALLQPPRNQWLELIQQLTPAIKDYIQKKKSDEIANQLQNMYEPPRAEAVDQYGATYDPQLAATQGFYGEEPDPSSPFTGGAEQAKVLAMFREQQEKQKDRELDRRYKEAQINTKGESRVPIQIDGQTYHVTPNAALEHFDRAKKASGGGMTEYQREQLRLKQQIIPPNSRAIARGKLDNKGEFTNNYEGAESGEFARVLTPKGDLIVVPWSAYEQSQNPAAEMYGGAQQEVQSGGGEPPTPAYVPTPPESFAKPGTSPTSSAPIKVNTPEEALKLPSGTIFQTPDGRIKRRP